MIPARRGWTIEEDGLDRPWVGRVWLFPPPRPATGIWVQKWRHEYHQGRMTAGLLYTWLDTRYAWWTRLAEEAGLCLPTGPLWAMDETGAPLKKQRVGGLLAYLGPSPARFRSACAEAQLGPVLWRRP